MKALKERLLPKRMQPNMERRESWRVGPHTTLSVANASAKRLPKPNPIINPTIIRHLFVLSLAWQIANVSIIVITDLGSQNQEKNKFDVAVGIMLLFQALHITLVIGTSIKLCKQVMHRTASPMFVVQSFLSTTLLYAGLFTLINRADSSSFNGFGEFANNIKPLATIQIFIKFWYFSTATMTTVGYGDVTPSQWYTQLLVTTQMLLSVTFTVVIFAQGLSHFNTPLILEHEVNTPPIASSDKLTNYNTNYNSNYNTNPNNKTNNNNTNNNLSNNTTNNMGFNSNVTPFDNGSAPLRDFSLSPTYK